MARFKRPTAELEVALVSHVRFLEASARAYDGGYEDEAMRLAVTIRVLVHNTLRSNALLSQLGRLSDLFLDTAGDLKPGNPLPESLLTIVEFTSGVGGKYIARLDEMPPSRAHRRVGFNRWWTSDVLKDMSGKKWNRQQIISGVANQEGGAHVDPTLDAAWAALTRNNSMGWVYSQGDDTTPLDSPHPACVRQIAHELLRTLGSTMEGINTLPTTKRPATELEQAAES